jgi:ribonucleases P/MRP protein subunit RPP25
MEAYIKVIKPREEAKKNEIKVALSGAINKYFRYANQILAKPEEFDHITIRASGNAIRKAIILVEDIKQKIGDLHQVNKIHTMTVVDRYEPKIEGLVVQEMTRHVTAYDCTLSRKPIDLEEPGYQAAKPA